MSKNIMLHKYVPPENYSMIDKYMLKPYRHTHELYIAVHAKREFVTYKNIVT